MKQIITSLLDTDFYKFSMSHAIFATCERLGIEMPKVVYKFKCRNGKDLMPYKEKIEAEIKKFQALKFHDQEVSFLMNSGLFANYFGKELLSVRLYETNVAVFDRDGVLNIEIEGPWFPSILYEVPVLAIVNELYFKGKGSEAVGQKNLFQFIKDTPKFIDFGTRRRFSKKWHEYVFNQAYKEIKCTGTSNVFLAKKHGLIPAVTMAHEWLQAFQALSRDVMSFQKDALTHWMLTYRGKLGIALTDIIGIDAFLKDWDPFFAKNYHSLRHDSGDPIKFMHKVEKWYRERGLPFPALLFSDGLDAASANKIKSHAGYKFNYPGYIKFGIGTHFTNNCGEEPLQIVIKLAKVNGQPVVKLSDSPGKVMCEDQEFIKRIRMAFNLKGVKE